MVQPSQSQPAASAGASIASALAPVPDFLCLHVMGWACAHTAFLISQKPRQELPQSYSPSPSPRARSQQGPELPFLQRWAEPFQNLLHPHSPIEGGAPHPALEG